MQMPTAQGQPPFSPASDPLILGSKLVNQHMAFERGSLEEPLITDMTVVQAGCSMCQVVTQQTGRRWEALCAEFATEEFLSSMLKHMLTQQAAACEALPAMGALVGHSGARPVPAQLGGGLDGCACWLSEDAIAAFRADS